ncbi:unnamed protein product [Bursaphelenchus xylophilus]|uniref:(pine wood nematode) hypothetical protein n=1 Tax=Bursaphelenchus xylophilus TaxID=6326 RepID=A0A1I7RJP1_BURXY|nr:unnamed protein product [Bursaphelenchus xylophilus]CAG9128973.1 unnamed protein product [Bursaphelenchus xylophilus]
MCQLDGIYGEKERERYVPRVNCFPSCFSPVFENVRWRDPEAKRLNHDTITFSEVTQAIFFSYTAVIHAITNFIPLSAVKYVYDNKAFVIILYSIVFTSQITNFYFDLKFILIGIERTIAFKRKATYEMEGGHVGREIVTVALAMALVISVVRCDIVWRLNSTVEFDARMRKVMMWDKYFPGVLFAFSMATCAMFYGVFVFRSLSKKLRKLESSSLSESYETRQIVATMAWLRRLAGAFLCTTVGNFPFMGFTCYLYFVLGYDEDHPWMLMMVTVMFNMGNLYVCLTTVFMFQEFPQLRNAVYKDFPFLKWAEPAKVISRDECNAMYFEVLRTTWRHPRD